MRFRITNGPLKLLKISADLLTMRCLILTTGAVLILPIRLRRGTAWIPSSKESVFELDCFLLSPSKVVLVANNLALSWPDGEETFYDGPFLRKNSPSAEQTGESDLFGKVRGLSLIHI